MNSEQFLAKKIATLFKRFDADNSGSIEASDFDKWSDKLVALGNLSADQAGSLRQNIKQLWNAYFQPADVNNDGKISCSELLEHIKKELSDESKRLAITNALPTIFDSIDSNKDDSVSKVEFGNYFKSLNINDEKVIDQVFNSMDANADGTLNKSEFTEFGKEFFFGQDQSSPSRLFFGPLE